MKPRKIILVSGKAQAGKDTFCNFYIEDATKHKVKVERVAFADELKHRAFLHGWNGSKEGEGRSFLIDIGQILRGDYELRLTPTGLKAYSKLTDTVTERTTYNLVTLFQTLSTEYIFDKSFWVKRAFEKIKKSRARTIIIPDWRFKNEHQAMCKLIKRRWPRIKLYTVRVDNFRSLHLNDPSEMDLDNFEFDIHIENHSNLDKLQNCVQDIFQKLNK